MHQIHCTWLQFIHLYQALGAKRLNIHDVTMRRKRILLEIANTAGPLGLDLDIGLSKAADDKLIALYEIALTKSHIAEG